MCSQSFVTMSIVFGKSDNKTYIMKTVLRMFSDKLNLKRANSTLFYNANPPGISAKLACAMSVSLFLLIEQDSYFLM